MRISTFPASLPSWSNVISCVYLAERFLFNIYFYGEITSLEVQFINVVVFRVIGSNKILS